MKDVFLKQCEARRAELTEELERAKRIQFFEKAQDDKDWRDVTEARRQSIQKDIDVYDGVIKRLQKAES